jgi:hypothetical protein
MYRNLPINIHGVSSESTASEIGNREILPIRDSNLRKKLRVIKNNFWKKYENFPLSYVDTVLVDGEIVIHVMIKCNESSISLPNKFEGYTVLFSYGSVEPDHRS